MGRQLLEVKLRLMAAEAEIAAHATRAGSDKALVAGIEKIEKLLAECKQLKESLG